jgi:hypothetical protein
MYLGLGNRQGKAVRSRQSAMVVAADIQTKPQDTEKAAVAAALAKDATEANVKAKVDAVVRIQEETAMLRCCKGLKPNMKDFADEQKTQLNEMGAGAHNQLFVVGDFGMRMPGMGGGRGAAPAGT